MCISRNGIEGMANQYTRPKVKAHWDSANAVGMNSKWEYTRPEATSKTHSIMKNGEPCDYTLAWRTCLFISLCRPSDLPWQDSGHWLFPYRQHWPPVPQRHAEVAATCGRCVPRHEYEHSFEKLVMCTRCETMLHNHSCEKVIVLHATEGRRCVSWHDWSGGGMRKHCLQATMCEDYAACQFFLLLVFGTLSQ